MTVFMLCLYWHSMVSVTISALAGIEQFIVSAHQLIQGERERSLQETRYHVQWPIYASGRVLGMSNEIWTVMPGCSLSDASYVEATYRPDRHVDPRVW
jgi:hypothetical protein